MASSSLLSPGAGYFMANSAAFARAYYQAAMAAGSPPIPGHPPSPSALGAGFPADFSSLNYAAFADPTQAAAVTAAALAGQAMLQQQQQRRSPFVVSSRGRRKSAVSSLPPARGTYMSKRGGKTALPIRGGLTSSRGGRAGVHRPRASYPAYDLTQAQRSFTLALAMQQAAAAGYDPRYLLFSGLGMPLPIDTNEPGQSPATRTGREGQAMEVTGSQDRSRQLSPVGVSPAGFAAYMHGRPATTAPPQPPNSLTGGPPGVSTGHPPSSQAPPEEEFQSDTENLEGVALRVLVTGVKNKEAEKAMKTNAKETRAIDEEKKSPSSSNGQTRKSDGAKAKPWAMHDFAKTVTSPTLPSFPKVKRSTDTASAKDKVAPSQEKPIPKPQRVTTTHPAPSTKPSKLAANSSVKARFTGLRQEKSTAARPKDDKATPQVSPKLNLQGQAASKNGQPVSRPSPKTSQGSQKGSTKPAPSTSVNRATQNISKVSKTVPKQSPRGEKGGSSALRPIIPRTTRVTPSPSPTSGRSASPSTMEKQPANGPKASATEPVASGSRANVQGSSTLQDPKAHVSLKASKTKAIHKKTKKTKSASAKDLSKKVRLGRLDKSTTRVTRSRRTGEDSDDMEEDEIDEELFIIATASRKRWTTHSQRV